MVRKIQANEYLRRYDNMDVSEKEVYRKRVGEWLSNVGMLEQKTLDFSARLQNVVQISATWNDQECAAFEEGAVLLSALTNRTDTWLPDMLYAKSAKRAIGQITGALRTLLADVDNRAAQPAMAQGTVTSPAIEASPKAATASNGGGAGGNRNGEGQKTLTGGPIPPRPKHIDQYVHLLPKETQERAALVQGLYQEMDELRRKEQLLMDSDNVKSDDREALAKAIVRTDNKLGAILRELDAEWAKLAQSGRVVVDDLGNARVIDVPDQTEAKKGPGRPVMTEEEKRVAAERRAAERETALAAENARKAALIRKWLIDMRNAKTEDQQQKWIAKYKEMVKLGGEATVTDKVREAAEYYGVDLEGHKGA